ncbi:hypothetical protein CDL15_Pgr012680 [Punica granatum]|uniref:Uncharacterized protein n=1 Tax=Punica granatum TaxID=22663 RepID=A0A218XU96_PUNGR|nr:hypothetical protein CDL15_Pgr012680 [Punica granatum]
MENAREKEVASAGASGGSWPSCPRSWDAEELRTASGTTSGWLEPVLVRRAETDPVRTYDGTKREKARLWRLGVTALGFQGLLTVGGRWLARRSGDGLLM